MARSEQGFILNLVDQEIRCFVASAIKDDSLVPARSCADQILRTYQGCDLSVEEIENCVASAAASAGVAVELGRLIGLRTPTEI